MINTPSRPASTKRGLVAKKRCKMKKVQEFQVKTVADKKKTCTMFGCNMQQLNKQYAANAEQLKEMAEKAAETPGKKYRGKLPEEWQEDYKRFKVLATLNCEVKIKITHDRLQLTANFLSGASLKWTISRTGETFTWGGSNDPIEAKKQLATISLWCRKQTGTNQERMEKAEYLLIPCITGKQAIERMDMDLSIIS